MNRKKGLYLGLTADKEKKKSKHIFLGSCNHKEASIGQWLVVRSETNSTKQTTGPRDRQYHHGNNTSDQSSLTIG